MSNVKKLLSDERRRSNSDSQKISEAQLLFAQVIKDYNGAIENIRQLQQEKRAKVIMNKDYYNGYPIIYHSNLDKILNSKYICLLQQGNEADIKYDSAHSSQLVDSLKVKLNQAQEEAREEKTKWTQLSGRIKEYELELERIPLLVAQVCTQPNNNTK